MTNLLCLIDAIYCSIFRSKYLTNKTQFLNFLLRFGNLNSILKILKEKVNLIADVVSNLPKPENVVR